MLPHLIPPMISPFCRYLHFIDEETEAGRFGNLPEVTPVKNEAGF